MLKLAIVAALFGLISAAPNVSPEAIVPNHHDQSGVVSQYQAHAPVPAVKPIEPVIEAKSALQQQEADQQPIAQGGAEPSKEQAAQPLVQAAVEAEPAQPIVPAAGVPVGKQILFEVPLLKTPASTAKLAPIAQLAPITYAAPTFLAPLTAWNGLTALPASYSIDQYGYQITY